MDDIRAWIQLGAAVITAIATSIAAYRAIVQTKEYHIQRAEARRQGVDPDQAEDSQA